MLRVCCLHDYAAAEDSIPVTEDNGLPRSNCPLRLFGICGVYELTGDTAVLNFRCKLLRLGDTVLHASGRVKVFKLCKYGGFQSIFLLDVGKLLKRGLADKLSAEV